MGTVIGLEVKVLIGCCPDAHVLHMSLLLFYGTDPFLFRSHAHAVTSSLPPGQLLLLQRTLLPRTGALWDGGSGCHGNCYVMAPSYLVSTSEGGVSVKFHFDFDIKRKRDGLVF